MSEMKLGVVESRFAEIIWDTEPVGSGELVSICAEKLSWKKSTTYTVLKKLCERGIFKNEGGIVTSQISRSDFYAMQSEQVVEESFDGSLPAFLAAFTRRRKLSDKEIAEIRALIDSYGDAGGGKND